MKGTFSLFGLALLAGSLLPPGPMKDGSVHYRVLSPITQDNLVIFPVTASTSFDTGRFLTLDEGMLSGVVVVTETGGGSRGLVRPRASLADGVWRERPYPPLPRPQIGPQVNELSLINNADRPLLLLAGEIVTGGKQDRVVSKDMIIPAHSQPISLGVFCVEPHRWTETSSNFGSLHSSMAQPSVRQKAMAEQNQQEVWDQVAKSRAAVIRGLTAPAAAPLTASSSYAMAMADRHVQAEIDTIAKPLERSYDALIQKLRAENAVGAVVAVNGQLIWADVLASQDLFNRYWPKLIHSYAAESFGLREAAMWRRPPSQQDAQTFLDRLDATHESIETEPGVYRRAEMRDDDYTAFLLSSLLPGTGFPVHLAKMKN
jgi:hypothetical protein